MLGIIDFLFNKIIPCGEVCLTINTLLIFISGVVYHFIATLYGVWELLWGGKSHCVELEMFKRITCFIYLLWFLVIIVYLLFNWYRESLRTNLASLNTSLVHGWEGKWTDQRKVKEKEMNEWIFDFNFIVKSIISILSLCQLLFLVFEIIGFSSWLKYFQWLKFSITSLNFIVLISLHLIILKLI